MVLVDWALALLPTLLESLDYANSRPAVLTRAVVRLGARNLALQCSTARFLLPQELPKRNFWPYHNFKCQAASHAQKVRIGYHQATSQSSNAQSTK